MHVISIANAKGGVGKTTSTLNLAYELARQNLEVLVIDIDEQQNSAKQLCIQHEIEYTIQDVLGGRCHISDACVEVRPGLYVLPGSVDLSHFQSKDIRQSLRTHLEDASLEDIDIVLIDHPPSLNEASLACYVASDLVLMVTEPDPLSIDNLTHMVDRIEQIKASLNPKLKIMGILINKVDMRRTITKRKLKKLDSTFGELLFATTISVDSAIPNSFDQKKTPRDLNWYGKSVGQFKSVAKEMLERMGLNNVHAKTSGVQNEDRSD